MTGRRQIERFPCQQFLLGALKPNLIANASTASIHTAGHLDKFRTMRASIHETHVVSCPSIATRSSKAGIFRGILKQTEVLLIGDGAVVLNDLAFGGVDDAQ